MGIEYERRVVEIPGLKEPIHIERRGGQNTATLTVPGEFSSTLTELGVLILIAQGKTRAEIAKILGIRPSTVTRHQSSIVTRNAPFFSRHSLEGRETVTITDVVGRARHLGLFDVDFSQLTH